MLSSTVPDYLYQRQAEQLVTSRDLLHDDGLFQRLRYYMQIDQLFPLDSSAKAFAELDSSRHSAYYYDLRRTARCFPPHLRFHHLFGDVTEVPDKPCLVKSRPVGGANNNSILLKLNRIRHFNFVKDPYGFREKSASVVWRGKAKSYRFRAGVVQRYYSHPQCDIGQSNAVPTGMDPAMQVPYMGIRKQLRHRYVLSMEGNDVATNLKWIMASNSLCMMRRPRFETWFMEGTLIPNHHYVELRDDHSDLIEKVDYYNANPDEAEWIIANAYVNRFLDPRREKLMELLVMSRYFQLSGQQVTNHSTPLLCPTYAT